MLQTWRRSSQLFSDFNNFQFAGVIGVVLFVILLLFMTDTQPHHRRWVSVDLSKVAHPVPMRDVYREDAMVVVVTRDGRFFLGNDLVTLDALPVKIANRLREPGTEQKVYVVADARARWGVVKLGLDAVRTAGIMRIAILTDQRRAGALHL